MTKITRWTPKEDEYLKQHAPDMTVKELTEGIKPIAVVRRSNQNVRYRCKYLGLTTKSSRRNPWSLKEEEFLQKNYYVLGPSETAKQLGRTPQDVYNKVYKSSRVFFKEQITPWMPSMLAKIGDTGKSIYDLSIEHYNAGRNIEILEKKNKFAMFCIKRET